MPELEPVNPKGTREILNFLLSWKIICVIMQKNRIEVAKTTKLREPTGCDRSGSNFAESPGQVWTVDGGGEKISVTVCGVYSAVVLSTYENSCVLFGVGREPTGFLVFIEKILEETSMNKLQGLKGSIVALVTPFNADGSVNLDKVRELTEWHIQNKTDAILVLGTTGESPTMTHEEDDDVIRVAIETAKGRVPIIAGTGSNCTQTMVEKSQRAEKMGADGLLLITPYYNKANAEGMYRHFTTVADAVNIPAILYNVPGRTGCALAPSVVEKLSKHPNIAGIKEASGDMSYAMKIAHCISPDFSLWCGNDDITIPLLSIGGSGTISVWANVQPRQCHDMVMDYLEGRREQAVASALAHLELMNGLFMEVNPIPVKTAMNMMGMEVGPFRLPLWEMSEANRARLQTILKKEGLLA